VRYNYADFPTTGHWVRTVALANREPSSAYKATKVEINMAEVVAIFDADEKCRAYLDRQRRGCPMRAGVGVE
jgi:hypothetical protein